MDINTVCFLSILKDIRMKRLIIILFSLFSIQCFSQLTLKVDSIRFTNIIDTIPRITGIIDDSIIYFEHNNKMGVGPTLNLYCSFVNNSLQKIDIDMSDYSTFVLFEYNGIERERYAVPCNIVSDSISFFNKICKHAEVLPNQKFSFYLSTEIFLLEPEIMERNKEKVYKEFEVYRYDYTNIILKIISTLKAKYVGKNINLISNPISFKEIKIN